MDAIKKATFKDYTHAAALLFAVCMAWFAVADTGKDNSDDILELQADVKELTRAVMTIEVIEANMENLAASQERIEKKLNKE